MIYDDAANLEEHAASSTATSVTSVSAVSATASTAATYEKLDLLERTLHATGRVGCYNEIKIAHAHLKNELCNHVEFYDDLL